MTRLLRLQARRDRVVLTVWVLGIALMGMASASAVLTQYGSEAERADVLELALATPSLIALRGVSDGPSAGSLAMFQLFAWLALAVALMNTFFATRHGRADEDRGRRDLVGAAPVSRLAPLAATLVLGAVVNVVLGLLVAGGFVAAGLPATGSFVVGAAFAVIGLAFLGLGALAGEIMPSSRAANGLGAALAVGAYGLRAAGDSLGNVDIDALRIDAAWPSWLSPIGWGQQTLAYTENRLWPLAFGVALAVVTGAAAVAVHVRREIGESLTPERPGPARASSRLRSPFGLAWRLQAGTLVGWTAGAAIFGLAIASLATSVADAGFDNPDVVELLESMGQTTQDDLVAVFLAAVMVLVGVLAAAAGVQAVLRLRAEEADGRAEPQLAAPVSRPVWLLSSVAVGVASVLLVVLATALTTWLGFVVSGDTDNAGHAVEQALLQLPAALVFVGLAAAFVAVLPRVSVPLGWGLFIVAVLVSMFGGMLDLPDAVVDVSPISHVPAAPVQTWTPVVALAVIAAALIAVATAGVRRRDLAA